MILSFVRNLSIISPNLYAYSTLLFICNFVYMEKDKLIKAINSKGLCNSLISIYYNIGRALPFRAQRFPDGRDSKWYRSQFVEVYSVKPSGKGGKYGDAYGLYYRNGEREDAWENDPEHSWCKKEDTEPQSIPCAACGSWVLLDILGEATYEPTKVYGLDDKLEFGKHKGKTLFEVIHGDWKWLKWAISESEHFFCDIDDVIKEREKDIRVLSPSDKLNFGKYKGKTIQEVFAEDSNYLLWLSENSEDFVINFSELNATPREADA